MDVTRYDRETLEASYYNDPSNSKPKCYGCFLLDAGEGGENQLAHMEPGGCLYQEFSDSESEAETIIQNKLQDPDNIPKIVTCIICCEPQKTKENKGFICDMCETKEDRCREIRYQSFIADLYACKK